MSSHCSVSWSSFIPMKNHYFTGFEVLLKTHSIWDVTALLGMQFIKFWRVTVTSPPGSSSPRAAITNSHFHFTTVELVTSQVLHERSKPHSTCHTHTHISRQPVRTLTSVTHTLNCAKMWQIRECAWWFKVLQRKKQGTHNLLKTFPLVFTT